MRTPALLFALGVLVLAAAPALAPITFEEISAKAGVRFTTLNSATAEKQQPEAMVAGVALFDYDSDGYADLYFVNGGKMPSLVRDGPEYSNRLFRNNHDLTFTDVTDKAGVAGAGYGMGVAIGDYDNDGRPDIYLASLTRNQLLHNNGDGTFTDVTDKAGVSGGVYAGRKMWSVSAAWLDYNNDSLLDLFVSNYCQWDPNSGPACVVNSHRVYCNPRYYKPLPNTLYRNNGDGTFTDVSQQTGIGQHPGRGMGVAVADYDGDGYPDIYVANDDMPGQLFHNLGGKRFEEVATDAMVAYPEDGNVISGMGVDFKDVTNNGKPSLWVTAMEKETFPLFVNMGNGQFVDRTAMAGLALETAQMSGWSNAIADLDNDGWKDLIVARSNVIDNVALFSPRTYEEPNAIFRNLGNGKFQNVSQTAGAAFQRPAVYRGLALGDLDNDGRLDAVFTVLNGSARVFHNTTANQNHWLSLRLIGMLLGRAASYSQVSAIPVDNLKYHQYSFYGQDSWKALKRLTVNYGIRFDHIGQWYPDTDFGTAVFDLGQYYKDPRAVNAGLLWHSIDKSIPLSGFKSPTFYYEPRIGVAYDIFGNGRTVLRGGFAIFRYQIAYNTISAPSELPLGVMNFNTTHGLTRLADITTFTLPTGTNAACGTGCTVAPLQINDGKVPYTENYNVSIDQQLPGRFLAEISYVGNRSRDLLTAAGPLSNINPVPLGAFFGPDPLTGRVNPIWNISDYVNDYRPLQSYGDVNVTGHGSYANYNSLQATLQRQMGPVALVANYTWSKVMGIRDNYSGNGPSAGNTVVPFVNTIRENYGVLAFNHTHIFNAGYVVNLPSPVHGNEFLKGAVNGWTLSGTTSFQTGAPIQPSTNGTMYANYGNVDIAGHTVGVGPSTWLGSNATGLELVPLLVCDPMKGLKSGQYFNPGCFAPPSYGSNGTLVWPNIHGPAYFNSDLAIYKDFRITERQRVQFRFSAFNFLNHPNKQFLLGGTQDLTLNFADANNNMTATNQNQFLTGKPAHTVGDRVIEFAAKYYF